MPRLFHSIVLPSLIFTSVFLAAHVQAQSADTWYYVDAVKCSGSLPAAQLDILEQTILDLGQFLLKQRHAKLTFHFQDPYDVRYLTRSATRDGDSILFDYSTGWAVEVDGPLDPNVPMYGFGWGAIPGYAEGSFSNAGYFDGDMIMIRDSFVFGSSMSRQVQCEHEWSPGELNVEASLGLTSNRIEVLTELVHQNWQTIRALEERIETLEAEIGIGDDDNGGLSAEDQARISAAEAAAQAARCAEAAAQGVELSGCQ